MRSISLAQHWVLVQVISIGSMLDVQVVRA